MSNLPNNLELGTAIIARPKQTEKATSVLMAVDSFYLFDAIYEGKEIVVVSDTDNHPSIKIGDEDFVVLKSATILSAIAAETQQ